MRDASILEVPNAERPILPWRFVAGAFIHLVIPVYLVAIILACTLTSSPTTSAKDLLAVILPFSARFLVSYVVITSVASLGAMAIDPLLRARRTTREATIPAARAAASARRCATAIERARGLLGRDAHASLDALNAVHWHHEDTRYQAIASDLVDVIATASAAMASAPPDRQAAISATTIGAIVNLATALEALAEERRALDEGDAATMSRYVQIRYGSSDFTGGPGR